MRISPRWLSIWRRSTRSMSPDGLRRRSVFLREPYFAGGLESLKAILIVESPSAFRRRLIFISADGLSRPRRGFEEESVPPGPKVS
jgi:hypothetical protein